MTNITIVYYVSNIIYTAKKAEGKWENSESKKSKCKSKSKYLLSYLSVALGIHRAQRRFGTNKEVSKFRIPTIL